MADEYQINDQEQVSMEQQGSLEDGGIVSPTLSEVVANSVESYLASVNGEQVTELYELVLSEIEEPMLAAVMSKTGSNQSRASGMLGLNRGTLRKKLKKYGLV